MHQITLFQDKKSKHFLGRGTAPSQTIPSVGRGTPSPHLTPLGTSMLAPLVPRLRLKDDLCFRLLLGPGCVCSVHYRTTHMHSTDSAVARCLSVRLSVTRRYSVYTVIHILIVFSSSGSFSIPNGMAIFRREPP